MASPGQKEADGIPRGSKSSEDQGPPLRSTFTINLKAEEGRNEVQGEITTLGNSMDR